MDIVLDELTGRITSPEIISVSSETEESSGEFSGESASEPADPISSQPAGPEPEESS